MSIRCAGIIKTMACAMPALKDVTPKDHELACPTAWGPDRQTLTPERRDREASSRCQELESRENRVGGNVYSMGRGALRNRGLARSCYSAKWRESAFAHPADGSQECSQQRHQMLTKMMY